MRDIHHCRGIVRLPVCTFITKPCFPSFIQFHHHPAVLHLPFREMHLRTSHRLAGSNGYTTLFRVIHGTIKMIHHPIVFHHITFMSEQFIIVFGRDNQIRPFPIGPVHQVITGSKGIECLVFAARFKSREVEHDIHVAHFLDMRIPRDGSVRLVCKDRIARIAFPLLHIL